MFYVHIDIYKKFKYFLLRYPIKAFIVISARKTHYTITVYTTVSLKMNLRFRNM